MRVVALVEFSTLDQDVCEGHLLWGQLYGTSSLDTADIDEIIDEMIERFSLVIGLVQEIGPFFSATAIPPVGTSRSGDFLWDDFRSKREFAILDQNHGDTLLRNPASRAVCDDTRDASQVFRILQCFADGFRII